MSLTIKEHRTFSLVPEGAHIARCYALIDLGMQYSKCYDNTSPKVIIGWELTQTLTEAGTPYVHLQRYTASLNGSSSLRILLEGWRGKSFTSEELAGFELKSLLGACCTLTIQQVFNLQTRQRWAKVIAISPLPPTLFCPPAIHLPIYFDLDHYNESDYLAVPEGIRKHINLPTVKEPNKHTQPPPTSTDSPRYHPPDPDEPQPDVDL